MPAEREDLFSCCRVPQLDSPVIAAGDQAPAVKTAREAVDEASVSAKVERSLRGKVPDSHFAESLRLRWIAGRPFPTCRGQSAVREEHHAFHLAGVTR